MELEPTSEQVREVRKLVLNRLLGKSELPTLVGLDKQIEAVCSLLHKTVANEEGNSALLIGPRSSGKSMIVHRALDALSRECINPGKESQYHIVRLNGFIHTNDRLALRDIARQLLIEQDLENVLIGSFSEAFAYILSLLREGSMNGSILPVLFILEEFDLLAQHPKQSLLYTLFDIAQSNQTPIAVLGITARVDVMDLLEKRVKSRFSHRQIYTHYVSTLEEFTSIAAGALKITEDTLPVPRQYCIEFNKTVDNILADKDILLYIQTIFDLGKDVRQLLRLFVISVSRLSSSQPLLQHQDVLSSITHEQVSTKLQVLRSISLLEVCLILSMKSLIRRGSSKYNFEMVYNEYKGFMSRNISTATSGGTMKIYKKPVALKAFESLVSLEIIRPTTISVSAADGNTSGIQSANGRNDLLAGTIQGTRSPKEFRVVQLMLEPGQVAEILEGRADIPAVIWRWAQE